MATDLKKSKSYILTELPRSGSATSPSIVNKKHINKDFKPSNRWRQIHRERLEQDECVDENFKLRSQKQLDKMMEKLIDDYKFNKEQAHVLKMERKIKDKLNDHRKRCKTFEDEVLEYNEMEKKVRNRHKILMSEFELNRYQLKCAKIKQKLMKKAAKEQRRLLLLEFYNSANFDIEMNEIEYNSLGFPDMITISNLFLKLESAAVAGISNCNRNFLLALANMMLTLTSNSSTLQRTISVCMFASVCGASTSTVIIAGMISAVVSYSKEKIFSRSNAPIIVDKAVDKYGNIKYNFIEEMSDISSFLQKILSADFVVAVRRLIIGLVSYTAFPSDIAKTVFDIVGTTALKMSGINFISTILTVIVKICRSAALWWHGDSRGMKVPLSEIFFGASPYDNMRESYSELGLYKENIYSGLPVHGKMCMFMYNKKATEFLEFSTLYLDSIGRHHPDYRTITGWKLDVIQWQLNVNNIIDSMMRVPAFPVLVVGPPGTGKSITTNMLAARPAVIKGYKFSNRHVYYKNSIDPYWEGFRCKEHNVVFMSEVAKQHKSIAKAKGDESLDSFLSACDSNPYYVNMAFGEKGKVPFLAELFIMDSNNDTLNLDVLYSNIAAFWRRILIVYQKVKPEWRKIGSCEIDSEKVLAAGINILDAFCYTLQKRTPINENESNAIIIGERDMGYLDMIKIFDQMFVAHQARNTTVNNIVMDAISNIPSAHTLDNPVFQIPDSDDFKELNGGVYGAKPPEDLGVTPAQSFNILKQTVNEKCQTMKEYIQDKYDKAFTQNELLMEVCTEFGTIDESIFEDDTRLSIKIKEDFINDNAGYVSFLSVNSALGRSPGPDIVPSSPDVVKIKLLKDSIVRILQERLKSDKKHIANKNLEDMIYDMTLRAREIRTINTDVTLRNSLLACYSKLVSHNTTYVDNPKLISYFENSISKYCAGIDCVLDDILEQVKADFLPSIGIQYNLGVDINVPVLENKNYIQFFDCGISFFEIILCIIYVNIVTLFQYSFDFLSYGAVIISGVLNLVYGLSMWNIFSMGLILVCMRFWLHKESNKNIVKHRERIMAIKMTSLEGVKESYENIGIKRSREVLDILADKGIFSSIQHIALGAICVAIVCQTIKSIMALFAKANVKYQAAMSKFDPIDDDIETVSGCKSPYKRVKNVLEPWQWSAQAPIHSRYLHTGSKDDFTNLILEHTFYTYVKIGDYTYGNHCFGLTEQYALINTHFHKLARGKDVEIHATIGNKKEGSLFTVSHCDGEYIDIGNDQTIALTTRKFKNMVKHIAECPVEIASMFIEDKTLGGFLKPQGIIIEGIDPIVPVYEYCGYKGYGLCGNILYTRIGKAYVAIGMHCAGAEEQDIGFSCSLVRSDLKDAINKLNDMRGVMPIYPNSDMNTLAAKVGEIRINSKTPFRHINTENIVFYGTCGPAETNKKSDVRKNFMHKNISRLELATGIKMTKVFTNPIMKPGYVNGRWVSPQNNALRFFTSPIPLGQTKMLKRITEYMTSKLFERLNNELGEITLAPYRVVDAVNGSVHDDFLRRINASTAAGYSFVGKKRDYLPETSLDPYIREPDERICVRIREILKSYDNLSSSDTIFKVSLKDEPVTQSKHDEGITRLFYVHELAHLIVSRMFLGPLVTLIQQTDAFYSMVGINMALQAGKVYDRLTKHPNYIEADAKKFDISASLHVRLATFTVLYNLAKKFGYNEIALKYLKGVLSDLLHPLYSLDGDLFSKSSVPSGHYGTAEMNCLIVMFFMVFAFFEGQDRGEIPCEEDFFDHVSAAYYGDDQSASISDVAKESVNNEKIADIYRRFNMELTAADKSPVIPKFVRIEDATFLKRTFKYSKFLDRIVAPLDPQSIYKMSSVSVFRDNCTERQHAISVSNSALGEWILHIIDDYNLIDKYNEIRDIYISAYHKYFGDSVGTDKIFNFSKCLSLYQITDGPTILSYGREMTPEVVSVSSSLGKIRYECAISEEPRPRFLRHKLKLMLPQHVNDRYSLHVNKLSAQEFFEDRDKLREKIEVLEKERDSMPVPHKDLEMYKLYYTWSYANHAEYRLYIDKWISVNEDILVYKSLLKRLDAVAADNTLLHIQYNSDVGQQRTGEIDSTVVVTHDVMTEIGGDETKEVSNYVDRLKFIDTNNDLDSFFLRPIQIGTGAITVGGVFLSVFDAWDLYMADPAVRAKVRNFTFMRATICIRFAISGTPFDAGRLLLSCQPYKANNAVIRQLFDIGAPSSWNLLRNQYLSQSKHCTIVDLKENKPVEFELPWVSPAPVARLHNNTTTALGSATNFADLSGMWTMYLSTLNVMSSIATAPSPAYYYIYAYLKDVQIGVPTGTQLTIVPNMSKQRDERIIGPVQRIASSMYTVSQALESVPVIGIYAKASTMAFGAMKSVAALFGWSAPLIMTPPSRVKAEPYQNGAACIQSDTGQKISFDPKQELNISAEYVGIFKDELVIKDLCEIKSYLTSFTWTAVANPTTNLYNLVVHPQLSVGVTGTTAGNRSVVPTPMGMIAQAFGAWHGKIHITLEVNCTAFHRGKLLILYDPNLAQFANVVANVNLNKQYTHVWDIQETQRYTICVDWNFYRAWASTLGGADFYNKLSGSTLTPSSALYEAANGFLAIFPFTKLQSPDGSDVQINIYVHGEDMMFNRPTAAFLPSRRNISYNSSKEVSNIDETCIAITKSEIDNKGISSHFFGEQPISLRSLLKRFVTNVSLGGGSVASNTTSSVTLKLYPNDYGRVGVDSTSKIPAFFGYFRQSFLAMRGGMRKRILIRTDAPVGYNEVSVNLLLENVNPTETIGTSGGVRPMLSDGSILFAPNTNTGFEFEIPYYSRNYYQPACEDDPFVPTTGPFTTATRGYEVRYTLGGTPTVNNFGEMSATAEDFQLAYFLGAIPFNAF